MMRLALDMHVELSLGHPGRDLWSAAGCVFRVQKSRHCRQVGTELCADKVTQGHGVT